MDSGYGFKSKIELRKVGVQSSGTSLSSSNKRDDNSNFNSKNSTSDSPLIKFDSTPQPLGEKIFDRLSFRNRNSLNPEAIRSNLLTQNLSSQSNENIGFDNKNASSTGRESLFGSILNRAQNSSIKNRRSTNFWSDNSSQSIPESATNQSSSNNLNDVFKKFNPKQNSKTSVQGSSTPNKDDSIGSNSTQAQPLIPTSKIDPPTQRLYFLCLSILILAFLLLDVAVSVVESNSLNKQFEIDKEESYDLQRKNTWRFLKWSFISSLYIFILFSLRIPRLAISKQQSLLLLTALIFLNMNLFIFSDNIFSLTLRAGISVLSSGNF
ncbi:hypothetical protein AYI70_g6364 [Smittium culicis]|uniref:Nucleoporin POM152 N-terminal transmembrane domain-containing protein n=1 Tax=Smittium culicis TaxID=133412 RepID=A0A1R1XQA3_9FUNG|nr:hypothetical protein AYI70_g6364 [Smittium culicis]